MLPAPAAVSILQQAATGVNHLHSLNIIHRDFRASSVLLASKDPLEVVVSDFGVSHGLWVYAETAVTAAQRSTPDPMSSGAVCPVEWIAPEVLATNLSDGLLATPASDVYMLGGLMFEVLTCGLVPYYWMAPEVRLTRRRLPRGESVAVNGDVVTGLQGLTVVEAAEEDGVELEWRVEDVGGVSRVEPLLRLMALCLSRDVRNRPTMDGVAMALAALL